MVTATSMPESLQTATPAPSRGDPPALSPPRHVGPGQGVATGRRAGSYHGQVHPDPATWTAPQVTRIDAALITDERGMLDGWLDYHRVTLLMKCAGLTGEQLKLRSCPPSTLSLLGLVRHMAEVERGWFRRGFAGENIPPLYYSEDNIDGDFDDVDSADVEADFAVYEAELAACRAVVSGASLDDTYTHQRNSREYSLRWIYLHLIEEYARHNGHADLIRERIDGVTGD